MSLRSWTAVLAAVVLLGPARAADDPKAKPAVAAPKWEYKIQTKEELLDLGKKDLGAGLNKLGAEGWELVSIQPASETRMGRPSGRDTYYFKRPAAAPTSRGEGPGSSDREFHAYKLKNANAVKTAKILLELFGDNKRVRIVADDSSNQILVSGSTEDIFTIAKVVVMLDVPADK
jgi:hypothetical protein